MLVFSQYINFFAVFVIINISSIFLAGWDFAIREPKYAKLNHSTLKTQLQLLLGIIHKLSKGNIGIGRIGAIRVQTKPMILSTYKLP